MVERWQKDADGILIFVSYRGFMCIVIYMYKQEHDRLVYSLPQSLRSLP